MSNGTPEDLQFRIPELPSSRYQRADEIVCFQNWKLEIGNRELAL
jgi:hypothetical protein